MENTDRIPEYEGEESPWYEEGWTAYQQDLERTDNPYDSERQPASFQDWLRGWMDALEEAEEVDR